MTTEKASNGMQLPGSAEWLAAPMKIYGELYREALGATARRLQEQADYVRKLAESDGPADWMKCNADFARKFSSDCFQESVHAFDTFRKNLSAAASPR